MLRVKCKRCNNILRSWPYQLVSGNHSGLCGSCSRQREHNGHWKGGITYDKGYKKVRLYPDDFFYPMIQKGTGKTSKSSGYVLEHRLVMAQHLERCLLPWELVHHKNGDRLDNRWQNLIMVTLNTHRRDYLAAYQQGYSDCLRNIKIE